MEDPIIEQKSRPPNGVSGVKNLVNFHDKQIFAIVAKPDKKSLYYSIQADLWTEIPSPTHTRSGFSCCVLFNSIYVIGGYNADNADNPVSLVERLSDAHLISDSSCCWETLNFTPPI